MTDAEVRRTVPAWIWGGALLAASAVVPTAVRAVDPAALGFGVGIGIVTALLFAASLVVFAFGLRGEGSVVDRRPGGVVALLVLAFVPPLIDLAMSSPVSEEQVPQLQLVWYVRMAVGATAALAAVVAIGRAGVLPHPWRWAPAWALAVIAVATVLPQVVGVAMAGRSLDALTGVFALSSLAVGAVPLALGILGMVLGARGLAAPSPQIYPPVA